MTARYSCGKEQGLTAIIEVKLCSKGRRNLCLACGDTIEKFEVHGSFAHRGVDHAVCSACLSGDLAS